MQTIAPGARVTIREVVWRVTRVDQTSTGKQAWHVVGVSEIVRDQTALFLEEFETGVRVLDPRDTQLEVDTSSYHQAGRLYIESMLRQVPPTDGRLYVGPQAVMDALPYQLEPAHLALQRPRQRILIADAVGLGKTLEAGVLLAELIRRGRARRILVVTTKSMLTQFQKELWCRFTIPLVRLDSTGLQRIRQDIPTHQNPFYRFDRVIISVDTLKQDNAFRAHVEAARWDVVVIDEAHNVAARAGGRSQRAHVAQVLADSCDHLILLSATPHDGKAESFASLMHLLDPTAIANPADYTKEDIKQLYTRRFRKDVAAQLKGAVPERVIETQRTRASMAEEAAFDVLTSMSFEHIDAVKHGGVLFRTQLEKALFSSPAACLQTVQTRMANLAAGAERKGEAERYAGDIAKLESLQTALEAIGDADFSRYHALLSLLASWSWTPRNGKADRLVVFTERRATLDWLESRLAEHFGLDRRGKDTTASDLSKLGIVQLHGGLPDTDQQAIVEAFGQEPARLRILLATDVASEGINLHYLSHRLIHFDVPWSLMVFQQRNGRVDRYGQKSAPRIAYLLTDSENPKIRGDQRILEVLISKDEQAQKNIGDPAALMGEYDVDKEVEVTAAAMEAGKDPQAFSAGLDDLLGMDIDAYLSDDTPALGEGAETGSLSSLYPDDFAYVSEALDYLSRTTLITADVRPQDRLIELTWPDDLKRRYQRLPREIRPDKNVILLTADRDRMQRAIETARKQESAWPTHQYLWALSPVVAWLDDRLQASFGGHSAPVLQVGADVCPARHVVALISAQLPNQRSQTLIHRWFAVPFDNHGQAGAVEPFEDFRVRTHFGGPLPNREVRPDAARLRALLPAAIAAAEKEIARARKAWSGEMMPQLQGQLTALEKLRDRQLAFWAGHYTGQSAREAAKKRRVEATFTQYSNWIREAMTPAEHPFVQVVAVLTNEGSAQ